MRKALFVFPIVALLLLAQTGGNIQWTQILASNRHGSGSKGQSSDGTGTSGNVAKFDSGGSVTDGGVAAASLITLASLSATSPITYNNSTGVIACSTCTTGGAQTIASGTATLGTSAITSGTCATVVTVGASGVATTDNIMADFNADPTGTTGYAPTSNGILTIIKYPTANNVNFKVCNNSGSSITPGAALALNWRVVR